ncbi:MAG: diguanylate cyclase/phosphodiesterase with sensor(s) [Candidatus Sulfotelmatobacter sp.]|nr:diguanylate cyclase/phosphodiesterase with sensor(s) [Candidatus Sulfotelmatobacter sp.]
MLLGTKRILGFEALLRWQHPQQGLISPFKFIEAAEDTGLLVSTGQWLILEACKQLAAWKRVLATTEPLSVSANISAKQLADSGFVSTLEAILRQTGTDPSQFFVEITENVAAANPQLTATILSQLRQLRVGVILDDFGSGTSSLRGLCQLPLEALKIDRSLVAAMLLDRTASDTVELIVLLAQRLKMKAIAEGIESAKQLDHLYALGCEVGQGYLLSQPVEAKAAELLLRAKGSVPQVKVAGAQ